MRDFLTFRRMMLPFLIQILFWLALLACIITGIINLVRHQFLLGIQVLILGPLLTRAVCELLILFFRMNETLTDMNNTLRVQRQMPPPAERPNYSQ